MHRFLQAPLLPPCHLFAALFTSNFTFLALSVIFLSPVLLNSLFPSPPLSLPLLPLSSVPRGYYLSRRQICPIINLISASSLPLGRSLFPVHLSFIDTQKLKQEKHLYSLNTYATHFPSSVCHTVKSQLCTLPPFSPLLPPFAPSPHWSGTNNNQKTIEGEEGTIED